MIPYPNIDPVLIKIGFIQIRWYGLSYIVGLLLSFHMIKKPFLRLGVSVDHVMNLMTYSILGVILGGRFGYIIFYHLSHYIQNPLDIFAVWKGGMSYHGAAIGLMVTFICYARYLKRNPLDFLDLLGLGAPFAVFLGRLANFINGELYGRVTDVPWAMIFPNGGAVPRHPSQLYEAFFEGIVLGLILWLLYKKNVLKSGQLFGCYLFFYGLFRFCIEFFREPDTQIGFVFASFSMGQVLCVVMMGLGVLFYQFNIYFRSKST